MCMEDILIGRRAGCAEGKTVLVANTPVIGVPANDKRIGLIMSGNSTAPVTLGFDNTITVGQGLIIPINQKPVLLPIQFWGEIVRRPIWVVAGVACTFTFWEVFLGDHPQDTQKGIQVPIVHGYST